MKDFKLRVYDGVALTCFMILPGFFMTGLSGLARENGAAAWIVPLVSAGLMACLFFLACALMRRYAGRDILQIASAVAGRPVALFYGAALCAYFCYAAGITIREITEIAKLYALFDTPLTVVIGCLLITVLLMNLFGGASLLKSVSFFLLILLAVLLFTLFISANRFDFDRAYPLLGHGPPAILKSSLFGISLFDGVIALTLLAPAFSGTKALRKSGLLGLLLAACCAVSLCAACLLSFSPAVSASLFCNFVELGKSSYFNHFFYRFESISLFFLIPIAALHAALCLFIARESAARAFGEACDKAILAICVIATAAAMLLPRNMLQLATVYLEPIRKYSACLLAGFPILLLIIHFVRRVFAREAR